MTIRAAQFGLCLFFLVTPGGGAQVKEPPAVSDHHGGFGLLDQRASRLLLMPDLARPDVLKTALCGGGSRVPVQFERRQAALENDGRHTARNFNKLGGSVFMVRASGVDPSQPCFLASDELLNDSTVLSIALPEGRGACSEQGRFTTLRNRRVINCWPLARLGADKHAALLEFERRGKDALAALVIVDGARSMFLDYPAEFKAEGESLWRVDDDGKFSPDGIRIICALQRGNTYTLGTAWDGFEGKLLHLWTVDGRDRFTKVISDYWYHAATPPAGSRSVEWMLMKFY